MSLSNNFTTSRLLVVGVIFTFIVLLIITWPLFRQALPETANDNQPMEIIPERTPAEIISGYNSELQIVSEKLNLIVTEVTVSSDSRTTPATVVEASKLLDDFFFSARVPEAARNAHLKAALEFKNIDSKKTDTEKLKAWQEIIKQLQTAVAAV